MDTDGSDQAGFASGHGGHVLLLGNIWCMRMRQDEQSSVRASGERPAPTQFTIPAGDVAHQAWQSLTSP